MSSKELYTFVNNNFDKENKKFILNYFYQSFNSKNFFSKKLAKKELSLFLIKSEKDSVNCYLLGVLLGKHAQYIEAYFVLKKTLKTFHDQNSIYFNLGLVFHKLKKYHLSNLYLIKSLDKQKSSITKYQLALNYQIMGKFDESKNYLNEIFETGDFIISANRAYSMIHKYRNSDDKHLKKMLIDLDNERIKEDNKIETYFAIGKAYDDLKDYTKAFEMFSIGNRLQKKVFKFSKTIITEQFNMMKSCTNLLTTKKFITKELPFIPIFIVGMPRSGTTITEQILASHSQISTFGETLNFPSIIKKYFPSAKSEDFLNDIKELGQKKFNIIRESLIELYLDKKNKYILDKLPFNFIFIGLINFFFPESKILHINRNPQDTCLSIFNNYFSGRFINFANDQKDIADYYSEYISLTNFYETKKVPFINVSYERLMKDIKFESKRILDYLNLSYEDSLMSFYKNKNLSATLSLAQVREKNNISSIEKWKNYEKFLTNDIKQLKSLNLNHIEQ